MTASNAICARSRSAADERQSIRNAVVTSCQPRPGTNQCHRRFVRISGTDRYPGTGRGLLGSLYACGYYAAGVDQDVELAELLVPGSLERAVRFRSK